MEITWLSLLPPLLAIVLAITTRLIYFSLFLGIWLGWTILSDWNPLNGSLAALDSIIEVFTDKGNAEILAFCLLIGVLLALAQRSGGVKGFLDLILRLKLVRGRRSASLITYFLGLVIFIEANINCLLIGSISRPIFDDLKISREKLAYICDSTSAPVCVMFPLNAWGATIIGLLVAQNVEQSLSVMIHALPFNFYAIFSIILVLIIILVQKDFGPMAKAEQRASLEGKLIRDGAQPMISDDVTGIPPKEGVKTRAINMMIPIFTMIVMMPIALYITGEGDLSNGSGSRSVLWAVSAAIFVATVLYLGQRTLNLKEISQFVIKGMSGLMPLVLILVLAFSLGKTCRIMGTGDYAANLAMVWLSPYFIPAIIFITACMISFSTGTSWGTFAIMIPFIVPIALKMDLNLSLLLGAVLSGGVFGDHCSPISDTTIVASMASASDHIDHVKTQLPYALTAGGAALIFFILFALI